jgi:DNA-binding NtrC family response regulator
MSLKPILVIDDEEAITTTVATFLRGKGYTVDVANDGEEALRKAGAGVYGVVLSDIYIDRVSGLDILEAAKRANPEAAVILMTARASLGTSIEAEQGGAFEYLAKPFEMRPLLDLVQRAQAAAEGSGESSAPDEEIGQLGGMIGHSPPMAEVYKRIARSCRSEETVLVVGETGVGKELVARAIHDHGTRSKGPFLAVDLGAVSGSLWESELFGSVRGAFTGADRDRPGIIDSARGGTVFFDEIGEVPLDFQAKLLRLLQEKEYRPVGAPVGRRGDVRVVAATNRDLVKMVKDGSFREDLYYRLNVLRIDVPPLRERPADIPLLARHFLEEAVERSSRRVWLEPSALKLLEEYAWPGNVRQLQNVLLRLVMLNAAGPITVLDVERELQQPPAFDAADSIDSQELTEVERRHILRVLEDAGGNKTRAAEMLGIQRRTLYKKLDRIARDSSPARAGDV